MASFITDQLAAGDRLLLLDALERSAVEAGVAIAIIAVTESPPRVLYANEHVERLFGMTFAEMRASPPHKAFKPEDLARMLGLAAARDASSPPITIEVEARRGDATFTLEISAVRISSPLGELGVCHLRDVTEQHETLAALRQSMERFRTLIERAPDGVVISSRGRIVFANENADRLFGLPASTSSVGLMMGSLLPPEDARRAGERIAALNRGEDVGPPAEYGVLSDATRRVEIKAIPWEWEGGPAVLAFARDVSERAALRRELARADRLAAIGSLAAAVAHEINNPLTYASLSVDLLEQRILAGDTGAVLEHARNARLGLHRVATIVRDLSTYAREQVLELGPVDLDQVIDRALRFVDHELAPRARVDRTGGAVPLVDGDDGRLEQVLVNLLVNAAHSLTGSPTTDVITVETHEDPQGLVHVCVCDTGPGVPAELRERVFEPFFTTKEAGRGTGLGLSVCKTLVEAMGGRIVAEAGPAGGGKFTVSLRRFHDARPQGVGAHVPTPQAGPRLAVLVVDDEPLIRRIVGLMLETAHDVVTAEDGRAALATLATRRFDAIVCDVMMPGMGGMQLHGELARLHPGLERRMIFVTGGAFVPEVDAFLASVENPKLPKPFEEQMLLTAIRAAAAS